MANITNNWVTFFISDEMQAKYPELIKLILNTESMDNDERQYWFDIMPSMTDSQIDRLFNILETERKKLEELEVKYQKEIKALNEKHLIEWQEFQMKKAKEKIQNAKQEDDKASSQGWTWKDDKTPDDILQMLNNI